MEDRGCTFSLQISSSSSCGSPHFVLFSFKEAKLDFNRNNSNSRNIGSVISVHCSFLPNIAFAPPESLQLGLSLGKKKNLSQQLKEKGLRDIVKMKALLNTQHLQFCNHFSFSYISNERLKRSLRLIVAMGLSSLESINSTPSSLFNQLVCNTSRVMLTSLFQPSFQVI